jgi:hypothetical protein
MWRGFRDPIHFSRRHPMTGASLGSSISKPFSPISISSHNTERNHAHTKKQLTKYQLLELWKCGAGWQKVVSAQRAHAIRWHCWIGVLSLEVLVIYQGKIIVALTYLFYFLFLYMHFCCFLDLVIFRQETLFSDFFR